MSWQKASRRLPVGGHDGNYILANSYTVTLDNRAQNTAVWVTHQTQIHH